MFKVKDQRLRLQGQRSRSQHRFLFTIAVVVVRCVINGAIECSWHEKKLEFLYEVAMSVNCF